MKTEQPTATPIIKLKKAELAVIQLLAIGFPKGKTAIPRGSWGRRQLIAAAAIFQLIGRNPATNVEMHRIEGIESNCAGVASLATNSADNLVGGL